MHPSPSYYTFPVFWRQHLCSLLLLWQRPWPKAAWRGGDISLHFQIAIHRCGWPRRKGMAKPQRSAAAVLARLIVFGLLSHNTLKPPFQVRPWSQGPEPSCISHWSWKWPHVFAYAQTDGGILKRRSLFPGDLCLFQEDKSKPTQPPC